MDTTKGEVIIVVTLISAIAIILATLILCVFAFHMKELKIAEESGIVKQYNGEKDGYAWKCIDNYKPSKEIIK